MESNKNENWQKINPKLIELFNKNLLAAQEQLSQDKVLCPFVSFNDNGEVKTYSKRLKKVKDFPPINDLYRIVKGVKDATNIYAVAVIYSTKNGDTQVIRFELEHRDGDCISIMVPYSFVGIFGKNLELKDISEYIITTHNNFVWNIK